MTQSDPGQTSVTPPVSAMAPTGGWDLVYAVRTKDVNARIADALAYPPRFQATIEDIEITGDFSPWTIVPGGAGYLVYLSLPMRGSVVQKDGSTTAFAGAATVSVELQYLDDCTDKASRMLILSRAADASTQHFAVQQVEFEPNVDFLTSSLVRAALQLWLGDHIDAFRNVFAVVSLGTLESETPNWLMPTSVSYAYVDTLDGSDGLLAILAMVAGRSSTGLDRRVTATAVRAEEEAGLLISPFVLLTYLVLPSLPVSFPGVTIGDFALATDKPSLSLSKPRQLAPIMRDGASYTPTLQSMTVTFDGTDLTLLAETTIDVGNGVTAHASSQTRNGVAVHVAADGTQSLAFVDTVPPIDQTWTTIDPAVMQRDQDIADAELELGIVISFLTGGTAGFLIMIAAGLISGIIANIPTFTAALDTIEPPSLDLLALNATVATSWTGGGAFTLSQADLVDSLRLSGSPWPARIAAS